MKPSSIQTTEPKMPQVPIFWSGLLEGIQIEIYESLLVDLKHPTRVALALELTADELCDIQDLCRQRKAFPATSEQVWTCYSSTGEESDHIDPSVYKEFLAYLGFANKCDWRKRLSEKELEHALIYLRKVGIPMIPLVQTFATQLRKRYREAEVHPLRILSKGRASELEKLVKKSMYEFVFALEKVEEVDQAKPSISGSSEGGIHEESKGKRVDVRTEEKRARLGDQKPGEDVKSAVSKSKDTISRLKQGIDTEILRSGQIRSYTVSIDTALRIRLRNNFGA